MWERKLQSQKEVVSAQSMSLSYDLLRSKEISIFHPQQKLSPQLLIAQPLPLYMELAKLLLLTFVSPSLFLYKCCAQHFIVAYYFGSILFSSTMILTSVIFFPFLLLYLSGFYQRIRTTRKCISQETYYRDMTLCTYRSWLQGYRRPLFLFLVQEAWGP